MKRSCSLVLVAVVLLSACATLGENASPGSPAWMDAASPQKKSAYWRELCRNFYKLKSGTREFRRCVVEVNKTARMNRARVLGLNWPRMDDVWGCPLPPVVLAYGIKKCQKPPRYGREIWPDAAAS